MRIFGLILLLVLIGSSLTVFVNASTMFTVPPLSEKNVNVNLKQGDSVKGSFSVTGGTGTGVDFCVTNPDGKQLLSYNFTSYQSFAFSASINGTYTLSFDNSFCSCEGGKNVTLEYSVNKAVSSGLDVASSGGFPVVPTVVLAAVIVAAATAVFLIRRPRANTEAKVTKVTKMCR